MSKQAIGGLTMTQEDKDLLLKDLCARLPYGTIVHYDDYFDKSYPRPNEVLTINALAQFAEELERWNVKPYLHSMDSMSNNQQKEYIDLLKRMVNTNDADILYTGSRLLIDFFNREHVDYRGLIEKGLAIEAPEGMYKKGE